MVNINLCRKLSITQGEINVNTEIIDKKRQKNTVPKCVFNLYDSRDSYIPKHIDGLELPDGTRKCYAFSSLQPPDGGQIKSYIIPTKKIQVAPTVSLVFFWCGCS